MRTRRARGLVPAAALLCSFAACGPSDIVGKDRLRSIATGLSVDSVITLLGPGPLSPLQPTDSLRLKAGYLTQTFLVAGEQYRILWYRESPGSVEDPITRETMTPILFRGDGVIAAGWADFDRKARELDIPNPYRSRERLDSIASTQAPKS